MARHRSRSRGLSMVELLVGTAIGLIVATAAASVVSESLRGQRRLLVEARLMQDLRTAADIISRDLRRAGHWADAASGVRGSDGVAAAPNPYAALAPESAASDAVRLAFSRGAGSAAVEDNERFGFRLRQGVLEMQLGLANWQALSDAGTLVVTAFEVEPRVDEVSLAAFCEQACAAGSTVCPPRQQVRSFELSLTARAATDASVRRSLRSSVRVRNDQVVGNCIG